jgi:hypothetical protein
VNLGDPSGLEAIPCGSATITSSSGVTFYVCVGAASPADESALGAPRGLWELQLMQETAPLWRIPPKPHPADPARLRQRARAALAEVEPALEEAAATQTIFTASQLECIAGIETGRTWNPNVTSSGGRVGLFQFNQTSWAYSGTSINWNGGQSARDPLTAASVALALLYRSLGYSGVLNPTAEAVQKAIDNFGEGDGRYGQAVMECARELDAGNFDNAYQALLQYALWVSAERP